MKINKAPELSPEDIVSGIDYGTISEDNISKEDLYAIKYYLEELISLKQKRN